MGRRKKKRLNARRQQVSARARAQSIPDPQPPPDPRPTSGYPGVPPAGDAPPVALRLDGVVLDESAVAASPMLPYVRMMVRLIEGIELSCREVLHVLLRSMRQHSIGARRRIDYVLGFLNKHPP